MFGAFTLNGFARNIRPFVELELRLAAGIADPELAFRHLERAHVLGQASTLQHVRVHWRMLLWGVEQKSLRECAGQLLRIVGAATKTALGWVPAGNTGGANISAFRKLPIPEELAEMIERARRGPAREPGQ